MTPELWQRLKPLYATALEMPEDARAGFISEVSESDKELGEELRSLLDASDGTASSVDVPLIRFKDVFSMKGRAFSPADVIFDRFEVESHLGSGGMGEVYRALDRRLNRVVAIKVLPASLSGNAALRERLQREARAASLLSHPHICTLYDVGHDVGHDTGHDTGEEASVNFLVMEFVEGETLLARLRKGPLGLELMLRYGAEIAAALDHAHRRGIVHRDLKPANVMITKAGVKLLDFGIAKFLSPKLVNGSTTRATADGQLTEEGVMLGTLRYMAPEQLEGKEADARSDIFALGVLLYEMATGQPAFDGNSKASLIAATLAYDPAPVSKWLKACPPALDRIVKQCLEKDPEQRWQNAGDLSRELRWIGESGAAAEMVVPQRAVRSLPVLAGWVVAALIGLAAVAVLSYVGWKGRRSVAAPMHLSLLPPDKASFDFVALSPDGTHLAFLSTEPNAAQGLWVRPLGSQAAQFFPDTADARGPFWSPDGRYIGFFSDNKLKRVAVTGGAPEILCSVAHAERGSWNQTDVVLYSSVVYQPVRSVNLRDCSIKALTHFSLSTRDIGNGQAWFLPDNQHYLWVLNRNSPLLRHDIYVGSLGSDESRMLIQNAAMPEYVAPGRLVFVRSGKLMGQGFNAKSLSLEGEPYPVVPEIVAGDLFDGTAEYSVSSGNLLVYKPDVKQIFRMGWVGRDGRAGDGRAGDGRAGGGEAGSGGAEIGLNRIIQISPDGSKILMGRKSPDTQWESLWIYQIESGAWTRFSFDPHPAMEARWSADGKSIFYFEAGDGVFEINQKAADGSGSEKEIFRQDHFLAVRSIAPDGHSLLFESMNAESNFDLWLLPLVGERKPVLFIPTSYSEGNSVLSPDGRWVAYVSNKSGESEIYVRPFPGPGAETQISSGAADHLGGGSSIPVYWRRDGKELFYLSADWKEMSVAVNAGTDFAAGPPHALFSVPRNSQVAAMANGQRFLVNSPVLDNEAAPLEVLVNWARDLPGKQ